MSRILLADHSPHAQRMGERILRDEGFEVITVTDGETVLLRLKDLAPDLILADISLPGRSGYEVCEYVKTSGKYPQTRVVLTAGPVTAFDEARAQTLGTDGFVRKPFEASVLLNTLQPLLDIPAKPAPESKPVAAAKPAVAPAPPAAPQPRPIDREQVRAAVILALESSMITIIENITEKVVIALEAENRASVEGAKSSVSAAVAGQGSPPPRAEDPKRETGPAPGEPVVHIRTPVFRSL